MHWIWRKVFRLSWRYHLVATSGTDRQLIRMSNPFMDNYNKIRKFIPRQCISHEELTDNPYHMKNKRIIEYPCTAWANKSAFSKTTQIFSKTFCGLLLVALGYFTLTECYFRGIVISNFDVGNPTFHIDIYM